MTEILKRKRIDNLKNGVEEVERFIKFKNELLDKSEIDLFMMIDQLTYIIWRIEHDLADGRIEYPEWDKNDKFFVQAEAELAIEQANKFGVSLENYSKWYCWWKKYFEEFTNEEWTKLSLIMKNKEDYSMYRPKGDWK